MMTEPEAMAADPGVATKADAAARLPWREFSIRWSILATLTVLHVGAVAALFYVTPGALLACALMWTGTMLFGITAGHHRLLAHQSYQTSPAVKAFHLFWGALALQRGPLTWARLHRAHHRYSDTIADPHTSLFGFFYCHVGWVFLNHRTIGRARKWKESCKDLEADAVVMFFERYHLAFFVGSLLALYAVGGLPFLLWGGAFRTVGALHSTWFINSAAHKFGDRPYDTDDISTNSLALALVTWGEGWHNNHHRFPYSARIGLTWRQFDPGWLWLSTLSALGLVEGLKVAKENRVVAPSLQEALAEPDA